MAVLTRWFFLLFCNVEMSKIIVDYQLSSRHKTVPGQLIDGKRVEDDRSEPALSYLLKYKYEIPPERIMIGISPVRFLLKRLPYFSAAHGTPNRSLNMSFAFSRSSETTHLTGSLTTLARTDTHRV